MKTPPTRRPARPETRDRAWCFRPRLDLGLFSREKWFGRLACALCASAGLNLPLRAADPQPVELPPMLVEESVSSVPWLHVSVGGTQFLSRCSESTTNAFIEAWLAKMQLMRVLVPEEFLVQMDVPAVCILYSQDLNTTVSAEIQRELQAGDGREANSPRSERVNIAPNMRLSDRDMHATIVYIDEALFDASTLSIAPGHVRFLLRGRVPDLPTWLIEGVERAWRGADFVLEPITLRPLVWNNSTESDALSSDPQHPRAPLPANELFATEPARHAENQHRRRMETRASTQELFFRWAIVSGPSTREALWKFVRAVNGPVTEEMFEAHFGFGFSDLRDRLSDYLPKAVEEYFRLDSGRLPPLPRFELERATPNEIARVRGEWERLAIGHVQRRLPQVREPYVAQARRTLRRAFDAGDRDPRLLAILGLCEIEAGNEAGARQFLEWATAGNVVRPRAYLELARIRFAELRRDGPETRIFSYTEIAPVLEPLRRGIKQAPPLPETFILLAEAWSRCEMSPNTEEFAELQTGAQLYARRPNVAYPIALALARHGKKAEAAAALNACAGHAADDATRTGMARLRTELAAVLPGER